MGLPRVIIAEVVSFFVGSFEGPTWGAAWRDTAWSHLIPTAVFAIDYLLDPEGAEQLPLYIDANLRLVECMNATLSSLNLAEMQVHLSLQERLSVSAASSDMQSQMLMMALWHLALHMEREILGDVTRDLAGSLIQTNRYEM